MNGTIWPGSRCGHSDAEPPQWEGVVCEACGKACGACCAVSDDGIPICGPCWDETPKCDECGIKGEDDPDWPMDGDGRCSQCVSRTPGAPDTSEETCAGCGMPVAECERGDQCPVEVLVVRQGAAARTADESALLLVSDCLDVGATLSGEQWMSFVRLERTLFSQKPGTGCYWFADPDDAQEAHDLAGEVVSCLPDGVWCEVDDGHVIWRRS